MGKDNKFTFIQMQTVPKITIVNTGFYESPMLQKLFSELSALSEQQGILSIFEKVGIKNSFIRPGLYFLSVADAEYRHLWFYDLQKILIGQIIWMKDEKLKKLLKHSRTQHIPIISNCTSLLSVF